MNFVEAEQAVRDAAASPIAKQQANAKEIDIAFEIFWRSNPSQHKFSDVCTGLRLSPAMLWIMAKVR